MESLLKFLRSITRLSLGLIFIATVVYVWLDEAAALARDDITSLVNYIDPVTSYALLVVVAIGIAAIGVMTLRILSSLLEMTLSTVTVFQKESHIHLAFADISEFVLFIYNNKKHQFANLTKLQSKSYPSSLPNLRRINSLMDSLVTELDSAVDGEVIYSYSYFSALSQVQGKIDSLQNDIDDVYFAYIVLITFAVAFRSPLYISLCLLGITLVGLINYIRKRRLSLFVVAQFFTIFVVNEGADIADREASSE